MGYVAVMMKVLVLLLVLVLMLCLSSSLCSCSCWYSSEKKAMLQMKMIMTTDEAASQ